MNIYADNLSSFNGEIKNRHILLGLTGGIAC